MTDMASLRDLVGKFIDARDWRKFQDAKELATSLVIESGELLELFQWKDSETAENELKQDGEMLYHLKSELADVIFGCLAIADHLGLDPESVLKSKLNELEKRYPVNEVKGVYFKRDEGKIDFGEHEK